MNAFAKIAISKLHIATAYETGVVLTADQAAELYVYIGMLEESGRPHLAVYEKITGSNPVHPAATR